MTEDTKVVIERDKRVTGGTVARLEDRRRQEEPRKKQEELEERQEKGGR